MADKFEKALRFAVGAVKVIDYIFKLTEDHPPRAAYSGEYTENSEVDDVPGRVTLGRVKKAIRKVEKFDVDFQYRNGISVSASSSQFRPYRYQKKLNGDYTVAAFIKQRLAASYGHHGFKIVVIFADGDDAADDDLLSEVRATYK